MLALKKFNSRKFSIKRNHDKERRSSMKRATSLEQNGNNEIKTLRDLIVKKLEKCLIIDQLNAYNTNIKTTNIEKKPINFILKTKFPMKKSIRNELKNPCILNPFIVQKTEEKKENIPFVSIKKDPIKKKKKKNVVSQSKQEITYQKPLEEINEDLSPKKFGCLIIKQKGLGD